MRSRDEAQRTSTPADSARLILVWDLPTRLLHWLLTVTVLGSTVLAMAAHGRSILFQLHVVLGLIAGFVVLLRVVWGLVGSRHARFSSFVYGPRALARYLYDAFRRRDGRHAGHNPGSSYAAYAMLIVPLFLAATGLGAVTGSDAAGHLHEPVAHLLVLVVAAHLAGIVWHTLRHRENVAATMVTGRKVGPPAEAIGTAHPLGALVFLVLTCAWAAMLLVGLDPASRMIRLPLLGTALPTVGGDDEERDDEGEEERDGHDEGEHRTPRGDGDHDDRHDGRDEHRSSH